MGFINLPSLDDITSIKDPQKQMEALINTVGLLMKSLSELNGYLQSSNIMEVGGWKVGKTELQSKDGDVGMSTEDTAGDDVRFWAGDVKDIAPFQVRKSGKASLTGANIQTSAGYPKVIIDPSNDLVGAYEDATNYIAIVPLYSGSPGVNFYAGGIIKGQMRVSGGVLDISGISGLKLDTFSGDINLAPDTTSGGKITVSTWSKHKETSSGKTLQDTLDLKGDLTYIDAQDATKATKSASTSSDGAVTLNGGIPVGTVLSVSGGGTVTWAGITVPAHTHTQN